MYACYVAIVTSYGVEKDGLKKISQREVTKKLRKREQSFFCLRHTVLTLYTML